MFNQNSINSDHIFHRFLSVMCLNYKKNDRITNSVERGENCYKLCLNKQFGIE